VPPPRPPVTRVVLGGPGLLPVPDVEDRIEREVRDRGRDRAGTHVDLLVGAFRLPQLQRRVEPEQPEVLGVTRDLARLERQGDPGLREALTGRLGQGEVVGRGHLPQPARRGGCLVRLDRPERGDQVPPCP
jgi:hypothetical protein